MRSAGGRTFQLFIGGLVGRNRIGLRIVTNGTLDKTWSVMERCSSNHMSSLTCCRSTSSMANIMGRKAEDEGREDAVESSPGIKI